MKTTDVVIAHLEAVKIHVERQDRAIEVMTKGSKIQEGEPCPLCGYVTWPSVEKRDEEMANEDS